MLLLKIEVVDRLVKVVDRSSELVDRSIKVVDRSPKLVDRTATLVDSPISYEPRTHPSEKSRHKKTSPSPGWLECI